MSRLTWFQKIYWQHFSKPVEERALMLHLLQQNAGEYECFGEVWMHKDKAFDRCFAPVFQGRVRVVFWSAASFSAIALTRSECAAATFLCSSASLEIS